MLLELLLYFGVVPIKLFGVVPMGANEEFSVSCKLEDLQSLSQLYPFHGVWDTLYTL